jgi:hypothetical protein
MQWVVGDKVETKHGKCAIKEVGENNITLLLPDNTTTIIPVIHQEKIGKHSYVRPIPTVEEQIQSLDDEINAAKAKLASLSN